MPRKTTLGSATRSRTVTKVVLRNGEEAQAIHDEWESVFETEHKAEALVLANYYKTTGYFADLTRDILNGVVPDMRAYTKMRGNKYAQKVLDTYYSDARYDVGTLVVLRARCSTSNITYDSATNGALGYASSVAFKTKGGIILTNDDGRGAGIRPRWGKVYSVGRKQKEIKPGEWVLVEHGRWTRGVLLQKPNGEELVIRRVDFKDIMATSDEPTSTYGSNGSI